jgi:hypothetical protein
MDRIPRPRRRFLPASPSAGLSRRTLRFPLLLAVLALGCQAPPPPGEAPSGGEAPTGEPPTAAAVPQAVLGQARSAADTLGTQLQGRLLAAIEEGGPLQAVEVCSVEAQEIARTLSQDGALVRRVSLRTRNPLNDPDLHETRKLEEWQARWGQQEVGEEWDVVSENGQTTLRYLRPIPLAGPCTTCHGDPEQIAPEVMALVRRLYPQDRALGFAPGDLRGAVSVSIPFDPSTDP